MHAWQAVAGEQEHTMDSSNKAGEEAELQSQDEAQPQVQPQGEPQVQPQGERAPDMVVMAQIYLQQGRVEDALAPLNRAIEIDPHYLEAWLMLSSILQSNARWEESLEYIEKAIQIIPKSAKLWFLKGNALDALSPNPPSTRGSQAWKHIEEALYCFEKCLQLDAGFIAVWFSKALCQEKLGRHQDAMHSYEKFVSLNPGPELEMQKEHACHRLSTKEILVIPPASEGSEEGGKNWIDRLAGGSPEDFLAFFDMTLQLNPEDPRGWVSKGYGLEIVGRDGEALVHYEKATKLDPESVDAWTRKGTLLAKLTRFDDALKCFEKAITIDPGAEIPWYRKGLLEQKLGRGNEAVNSFRKFLQLDPPDSMSHEVEDVKRRVEQLGKKSQ